MVLLSDPSSHATSGSPAPQSPPPFSAALDLSDTSLSSLVSPLTYPHRP